MVKVVLPRGSLCDISLMGVGLVIPPVDLEILDLDVVTRGIEGLFAPYTDISAFGDVNGDHIVDEQDSEIISAHWGAKQGDANYLLSADINKDGKIDYDDLQIVLSNWGLDRSGGEATQVISKAAKDEIKPLFDTIPKGVFDAIMNIINTQVQDYHNKHPEEFK